LEEASPPLTTLSPESGSFRDWDGRVFGGDGRVLRALSAAGVEDWRTLAATDLFARYTQSGALPRTHRDDDALDELRRLDPEGEWEGALSHERLPFVSYPYEWPFSMLKDAAQLQLELTSAALAEGLMLKDGSPYNIQWRGSQPVFVDLGSFEHAREGEAWPGYRQFCSLYLYPLMLEAYRGAPFQPWLRGSIDGISPVEFRKFFGPRDSFRPGMLRHVFLHASLERRYAARGGEVREALGETRLDTRVVQANVAGLTKLVRRLRSPAADSAWRDYDTMCTYTDADTAAKEEFVRHVVVQRKRRLVWDLGCNEGRFSRIAAEGADYVVAVDSDPTVVDAMYLGLARDEERRILPLVVDLADPSPSIGWRNRERVTLVERGRPELVLGLALVHHLSITRNVPLRELVDWLRSFACELVVEFPAREDSMVQRLLGPKRPNAHPDYDTETWERLLRERFEIVDSLRLPAGTRTLFFARPR
jgi:SAM-dependent methyltransferase